MKNTLRCGLAKMLILHEKVPVHINSVVPLSTSGRPQPTNRLRFTELPINSLGHVLCLLLLQVKWRSWKHADQKAS